MAEFVKVPTQRPRDPEPGATPAPPAVDRPTPPDPLAGQKQALADRLASTRCPDDDDDAPATGGGGTRMVTFFRSRLCLPVFALLALFVALGVSVAIPLYPMPAFSRWVNGLMALAGIALSVLVIHVSRNEVVLPLAALYRWVAALRQGRLSTPPPPIPGVMSQLSRDLGGLACRLDSLSQDLDDQVRKQTEHIQQKTRSLEILYDVAASINTSRDLDDLLTRFLHTLKEVVNARAATVRLLTDDNRMRLVAAVGLSDEIVGREDIMAADQCLCGQVISDGSMRMEKDIQRCSRHIGADFFGDEAVEMIAIPLQYRGRTLGVYNLFVDSGSLLGQEDHRDLLISIGRHLGMAIEKASVDKEANRLSIIEERNRIAHELHDSLAQTLASLRFQVRVLDETLHQGDESALWSELERIENSLDEAYTELRGLIEHFRAPVDARGLVPAIEKLIHRFRAVSESPIQIFLQQEWKARNLPEDMEIQVLRIVQEALNNVHKHSGAHTVRVLLRSRQQHYEVLVEDDGKGLPNTLPAGGPGEHVGLSIMEERARRLGGRLRIESEPGEGTRVQLQFDWPAPDSTGGPPHVAVNSLNQQGKP